MRIILDQVPRLFPNNNDGSRKQTSSASAFRTGQSYDAITISSASPREDEKRFAAGIAKALSQEMRSSAPSEDRLEHLKDQIDRGLYQVDADSIVAKMLLVKGDANYE